MRNPVCLLTVIACVMVTCPAFGGLERFDEARNAELIEAVRRDDEAAVAKALAGGASPDSRDKVGDTALVIAARKGSLPAVNALLKAKAKPTLRSTYGKSPIVEAAANGHRDVIEVLLVSKTPVDTADSEGTTPLIAAAARGDLDLIHFLLDHRAKVDQPDVSGATALMLAAGRGQVEAIGLLLSKRADLKRVDRFRRTALFYAAVNARPKAAAELLAHGADAKWRDADGLDAYQSVIETMTAKSTDRLEDRLATLRALQLSHNPASRDNGGRTDLMIAAERGIVPIVKYLLTLKPDINAKDRTGRTALDWAEVEMRDETAALLKAAGGVSGG